MGYTKEGLPKTYTSNGEKYRIHDSHSTYTTASWQQDKLRSDGWKVLVTKILGVFVIYKRRP